LAALIPVLIGLVSGCSYDERVTGISIEDTTVYLSPEGVTSTVKLNPVVECLTGGNERVTYSILDPEGAKYIQVGSDGTVTALGRETGDKNIVIRIRSVGNPKIYVDVRIVVAVAEVQRITFSDSELLLYLGSPAQRITPVIIPAYAAVGASLGYEIENTSVATVDENGYITPVGTGVTSIKIYTIVGFGEKSVEAWLSIRVEYNPLNYYIKVRNDEYGKLKQMKTEGVPLDSFWIDVYKQENDPSDPSPQITWYLNGTPIQRSDYQGKMSINFDPEQLSLVIGPWKISAVLTSGEDVLERVLPILNIYNPLEHFSLVNLDSLPAGKNYKMNDPVRLVANHGDNEYPPDSYRWYIVNNDIPGAPEVFLKSTEPVVDGAGRETGFFLYTVDRIGNFSIICKAVIKNVEYSLTAKTDLSTEISESGNDISGIYIDGANVGGYTLPYIKWDPLPYDADYEVLVKIGETSAVVLKKSNSEDAPFFTEHGCYIPHGVVTLADDFKVQVRGGLYGYSQEVSYEADTIEPSKYKFLDNIVLDYNSYIVDMSELGELLNYINVFRPAALAADPTRNVFDFTVYIPFTPQDVSSKYELPSSGSDFTRLLQAAFNAYCETSGNISYPQPVQGPDGEYPLRLTFVDSMITTYLSTPATTVTEYPMRPHYASSPRPSDVLPIDDADDFPLTLYAETSNQLYLAASMGYRPVPVPGSGAETIDALARAVLKRIINDGMSAAEKLHAIYDYLTTEIIYDYDLRDVHTNVKKYDGFYLEGVFIKHKAVCDGIAKAFNLLSWYEGIASKKVNGYMATTGDGHAWNLSNVFGSWYVSDATWGNASVIDGSGMKREYETHKYLLTTDAAISADHVTLGEYPVSSETRSNVYLSYTLAVDLTPVISFASDIDNILNDYIFPILTTETTALVDIYLSPEFMATYPITYEIVIKNRISLKLTTGMSYAVLDPQAGSLIGQQGGFLTIKINR